MTGAGYTIVTGGRVVTSSDVVEVAVAIEGGGSSDRACLHAAAG